MSNDDWVLMWFRRYGDLDGGMGFGELWEEGSEEDAGSSVLA